MDKIKEILLLQKQELENYYNKLYIQRDKQLKELDSNLIKVVIGPRRAGKSFYIINELKNKHIGYVNFDDEGLKDINDLNYLIESIKSIYNMPKILFFDEIQNLENWELFVNRLQRQGYNIILTGSNSNLLSRELSTHLTGRHLCYIIFPFSFKEYIKYFSRDKELIEAEKKSLFENYLIYGGFPEPLIQKIEYSTYLKTLCDAILLKDVVSRYNILNIKSLENLFNFIISNPAQLFSYNNLLKLTTIKSVRTIIKYLKYLEETFLLFQVNRFSFKIKEQINSPKKIYICDNGYITSKAVSYSTNFGKLYENIVAVNLKQQELENKIRFFYYQNRQKYETDFVIQKDNKISQLIQVCYDITLPEIKNREIRGLVHTSKDLKCDNLIILNKDYENEEKIQWYGEKYSIKFIPLYKWLLNNDKL